VEVIEGDKSNILIQHIIYMIIKVANSFLEQEHGAIVAKQF